jgi:hypothetical protein
LKFIMGGTVIPTDSATVPSPIVKARPLPVETALRQRLMVQAPLSIYAAASPLLRKSIQLAVEISEQGIVGVVSANFNDIIAASVSPHSSVIAKCVPEVTGGDAIDPQLVFLDLAVSDTGHTRQLLDAYPHHDTPAEQASADMRIHPVRFCFSFSVDGHGESRRREPLIPAFLTFSGNEIPPLLFRGPVVSGRRLCRSDSVCLISRVFMYS